MEEMYDKDGARKLTNFSYVCTFANSIRATHAVDCDLPAVQEALQTSLMNYLEKNPLSEEYKWPLADLSAYGYDFSHLPQRVRVVDPMSLILSSTPPLESEPGTPYVEGVSPLESSPPNVEDVVEGGNPIGEIAVGEASISGGLVRSLSKLPQLERMLGELP